VDAEPLVILSDITIYRLIPTEMPHDSDIKPQWYQILLALADGPRHGLGIRDEVLRQTDGRIRLWPAMLYGSLRRMEEEGLIAETESEGLGSDTDRRRFYQLTRGGRRALAAETAALAAYVAVAKAKNVALPGH